jgi:hypothetical protein
MKISTVQEGRRRRLRSERREKREVTRSTVWEMSRRSEQ